MSDDTRPRFDDIAPDQRPLTEIQARRLGSLTRIEPESLVKLTIADISEKLKWRIDPSFLLFRKVCGQVVKKDPVTGQLYPVPFATVHVEDTDCGLFGYWPIGWPWGWFFPFGCHREEIATAITDECGNFCVWIPRFDIDWILTWRKSRICWPDIFIRPTIRDLIPIEERPQFPPRPFPEPDPPPFDVIARLSPKMLTAITGTTNQQLVDRLSLIRESRAFGTKPPDIGDLLNQRAFEREVPPPLPVEFRKALTGRPDVGREGAAKFGPDAVRGAMALRSGISIKEFPDIDLRRYIGPFFRCRDIFIPEWQRIVDVPDITFRVTQDTNGDGIEENIYSEGFFDVRWNAGTIPPPTLIASSNAVETRNCHVPEVACGNEPAILFAGLHPVHPPVNPYLDPAIGYARRPNRPSTTPPQQPPESRPDDAETPFCRTLQLWGCVNIPNASYYHVLHSEDNGANFSTFTGVNWPLHPVGPGPTTWTTVDSIGWYPVITNPALYLEGNLVFEWSTPLLGKSIIRVEVADGTHTVFATSTDVALQIDNTQPTVIFNKLAWKFASEPDTAFDQVDRNLLVSCPVIRRGDPAQVIQVRCEVSASAHHLRNALLGTSGCGGGAFVELSMPAPHSSHWHDSVLDNSEQLFATYELAADALEGCYTFACTAYSRAFNPAGGDDGHLHDWYYDPVYIYTHSPIDVSVVNG